ncbi:MAG: hypothetical protein WCL39_07960 [Armatimonadota bacterium]
MISLYQWVSNILGLAAFAVTLFVCVTGGQDMLTCALKSIGVCMVIRMLGSMLGAFVQAVEQTSPSQGGGPQDNNQ